MRIEIFYLIVAGINLLIVILFYSVLASIRKNTKRTNELITALLVDKGILKVYTCKSCGKSFTSENELEHCAVCGEKMV